MHNSCQKDTKKAVSKAGNGLNNAFYLIKSFLAILISSEMIFTT